MHVLHLLIGALGGCAAASSARKFGDTISKQRDIPLKPRSGLPCVDKRVIDTNHRAYMISCNSDTSVKASSNKVFKTGGWGQCMLACDEIPGCVGFTWTPSQPDGGVCFFKSGKGVWSFAGTSGYVAGILEGPPAADPHNKATTEIQPPPKPTPTPAQPPPKPKALQCGVWDAFEGAEGFSLCQGRVSLVDYCSRTPSMINTPNHPTTFLPKYYYSTPGGNGILITHYRYPPGDPHCDDSSMNPPAVNCGSYCDPNCYANLAGIMNDCDTDTITNKMGGTKVFGCDQWGIYSVTGATGSTSIEHDRTKPEAHYAMCKDNPGGGPDVLHPDGK